MTSTILVPSWKEADYGRYLFKAAVSRTTPEVLTSLYETVLPAYLALTPEIVKRSFVPGKLRPLNRVQAWSEISPDFETHDLPISWWSIENGSKRTQEAAALKVAMESWAKSHHFADGWLLDAAFETLFVWKHQQPAKDAPKLRWDSLPRVIDSMLLSFEEREFGFTDIGWDETETWKVFEDRIRREFARQLLEYKVKMAERASNRGWTKQPVIRNKDAFDWLALYQIRGASPKDIAVHFRVARKKSGNIQNTILQAVREKARLIGLSLRPGKRGSRTAM